MKKVVICILALGMGLGILCGCKKQNLPVPEYPLKSQTIAEALQEWGLTCTIQEDDLVRETREGQTLYNIRSAEDDRFVAGVSSGQKDGERILFVSLPPLNSANPIPAKECEGAIAFATRLFGGFENALEVYDHFIRDYDAASTQGAQHDVSDRFTYMAEGETQWEGSINGTTCRISLAQPTLSEPQEYVRVIIFVSDWDTFYPE